MAKPLVAVVGRPNVGKSTFFNRICSERRAIVQDIPGVTRDRIYAQAEWCGKKFSVVDTGGLEPSSADPMQSHIREQANLAIETADVILFFVDGKEGLVAGDFDVAEILRRSKKPVLLAVNKLDNYDANLTYEFYNLGMGEPYGISSEAGKGIGDLLDEAVKHFPDASVQEAESEGIKVAVVGKPNAGKSSLVNRLLGEERVIVSDIAGTTRDSIDSTTVIDGKTYIFVDTAGMRRQRSVEYGSIEAISAIKAMQAIERADVVLMMIDASVEISEQDIRLAGVIHNQGKPSIIVMNKWDKVEKDTYTIEKFNAELKEKLKFMDYFLPVYISAVSGKRTDKLVGLIDRVYENAHRRIPTGTLNEVITDAVALSSPPTFSGRRLKIMYTTQVTVAPPNFVLFVNNSELMHFSYLRYLENSIRSACDFSGTPIRLTARSKQDEDK